MCLCSREFLAGVLGGVLGGWVKLKCEEFAPPRGEGREAPPAVLIKKLAGSIGVNTLSDESVNRGTMAIHWIFSGVFGGMYGVLAERLPIVRAGGGSGFGLAVWIGAHELTIPAMGLSPILPELPVNEQRSEAFSHLGYGISLELTRRFLRSTVLRTPSLR